MGIYEREDIISLVNMLEAVDLKLGTARGVSVFGESALE